MALDRVAKIGDKGGMNGNQQRAAQDIGGITIEHADGWAVQVRVRGTDSGPGLRGGDVEIDEVGEPWLTCRESWLVDHPGVEPTTAALEAAMEQALDSGWLLDEACDAADRGDA